MTISPAVEALGVRSGFPLSGSFIGERDLFFGLLIGSQKF
jgi:hypothetical protein